MTKTNSNKLLALFFVCFFLTSAKATESEVSSTDTLTPNTLWLDKLTQAIQTLNYRISFIHLVSGYEAQPYLWRHSVDENGVSMEQISMLNGPSRDSVRVGNQVSYFEANMPAYSVMAEHIESPLPRFFSASPQDLLQSYDLVSVSQGRVAGRIAQQVRIVSRDKTRYGISLWLDKHTGLPLKINTTDLDGQLVDQIQVTDLQILNQADSTFDNLQSDKLPSVVPYRQSDNMLTQVNFGFLPQGMNIVRQDRHFLPMLGQPVDYWLLSDGVVPISVFVHAGPKGSDILTRARAETILSQPVGRCYVTLIGKLPARTAKGIVDAMQIRNNQP